MTADFMFGKYYFERFSDGQTLQKISFIYTEKFACVYNSLDNDINIVYYVLHGRVGNCQVQYYTTIKSALFSGSAQFS